MEYGYSKKVNLSFEEAVAKVTEELKKEGFGVLTEINVKDTLKKKLDVDFKPYMILCACNPPAAYKALQAEERVGLLLPCNVIVYETGDKETDVSAIEPDAMMSVVDNPDIHEIAREIRQRLHRVIDAV
ncbi:hypothetical protein AMJ80_09415 [bacterium SM23_31]|nr:MAG: hypothetical protein AMJ80_09415 [bacterium SM23_31]